MNGLLTHVNDDLKLVVKHKHQMKGADGEE